MIRTLLIEDDETIAGIICYYLEQTESYEVVWARDAGEALGKARDSYDVILLDVMLPDASGIKLCDQLRKWHNCPIIYISCMDDNDTIVSALEMGGDDYLVKPFDNRVLDARIRANLRRMEMGQQDDQRNELSCKGLTLDAKNHEVRVGDVTYELLPMEFKMLRFFMLHPKRYFTASELYREIWGKPSYGDARTVTAHVYNLRKKIEKDPKNPRYLVNVWGRGYLFNPK